jgi:valyl-tRNA synthetase
MTAPVSHALPPVFQPAQVESDVYPFWEDAGLFQPQAADGPAPLPSGRFSLVIPPPNVTGTLHMGHALDCTLQDILVRWHRMRGNCTLWLPGTDHAGIATQNVVERQLRQEGSSKEAMGREAFLARVWTWARERQGDIWTQFRRLGISPDWSRQRFTLDEGLSRAVREAFVTLYERGLIYRGTYIVNWCPRCTSAISDIETDYEDRESFLWQVAYVHPETGESLTVATTRPETLFADVALAVHPEDARYQGWVGRQVRVPLTQRLVPVIADPYVAAEFGTGVLKITPAHDPNDFKIGQAHGLPPIYALDIYGHLCQDDALIPPDLQGLERFEARVQTEAMLEAAGLLRGKTPHANRVGQCQRCSTVIEPLLSQQWFVKTQPMAQKALEKVASGQLRFIPERWTKDFVRWMTDIEDWCISRQLWWGHQIPAWVHRDTGELRVLREAPDGSAWEQVPDVLDTWFSSGLWPFSTMGWPDTSAPDYQAFYPTNVLVTGFDIIFFWVARMVMLGQELTGSLPFQDVYIHGLIRDEKGQKMSKSKGNVVDPVAVIDANGCDGFRWALTSLVTYGGQDIKLSPDRLEQGKLFANKLWNASRFVLMHLENTPAEALQQPPIPRSLMDHWILAHYQAVVAHCNTCLAEYKFGEMALALYDFTWSRFCDWYVEAAKGQMKDNAPADAALNTRRLLAHLLDGLLRLWHPVMPFITETLWQQLPTRQGRSISVAPYPQANDSVTVGHSQDGTDCVDYLLDVIRAVRNIRQTYGVAPSAPLTVLLETHDLQERAWLDAEGQGLIGQFIRLEALDVLETAPSGAAMGLNVVGKTRVLVPLAGLIDVEKERQRLAKKQSELEKERQRLAGQLANEGFMARAPEALVVAHRSRLAELADQLAALAQQCQQL